MSVWILSKTDLDAFVTIALRWTERGDVAKLPEPARTVLHVTHENASDVGARLWQANHDSYNYGGPRHLLTPELAAKLDARAVTAEPYTFEALPGFPPPQTAVARAGYYEYQTAGDYWDERNGDWPDGRPPFELLFTTAMQWYGLVLLGATEDETVPAYDEDSEAADVLMGDPIHEASGWELGDDDRDLFVRLERMAPVDGDWTPSEAPAGGE